MTAKPRNRIVVFRLTQDEYRSLREACDRRGSRNLSDFTRSELLEYIHSGGNSGRFDRRFAALEQRLDSLQNQVSNLLKGTFHAEPQPQP